MGNCNLHFHGPSLTSSVTHSRIYLRENATCGIAQDPLAVSDHVDLSPIWSATVSERKAKIYCT